MKYLSRCSLQKMIRKRTGTWHTLNKIVKLFQSKIEASEIAFLTEIKKFRKPDHKKKKDIRKVFNSNHRLKNYKQQLKEHLERMLDSTLAKQIWIYELKFIRLRGDSGWDGCRIFESGTGSILPTLWWWWWYVCVCICAVQMPAYYMHTYHYRCPNLQFP